jgi:hypothetical protein
MRGRDDRGGESLTPGSGGAPPAPSATLLAALGDLKPVRTRVPARAVALLAMAGLAAAAAGPLVAGLRRDLGALPAIWVVAAAAAWLAGLLAAVLAAAWPRRGEVLPDASRAARAAVAVAAGLMALGLFATVDAPGHTVIPEHELGRFGHLWWHCTKFSLTLVLPLLVVGGLVLRRLFPMGGARIGAALGAAAGAAAGLALHFSCPIGGGLHVGLAHAGGVALGALLGMVALPKVLRG